MPSDFGWHLIRYLWKKMMAEFFCIANTSNTSGCRTLEAGSDKTCSEFTLKHLMTMATGKQHSWHFRVTHLNISTSPRIDISTSPRVTFRWNAVSSDNQKNLFKPFYSQAELCGSTLPQQYQADPLVQTCKIQNSSHQNTRTENFSALDHHLSPHG